MENLRHQASFDAKYRSSTLLDAIRRGDTDEHGLAYRSPLHRMIWWRTSENIWDMLDLPDSGALLNVGVGFGLDEKVLHERFPALQLWGVDISTVMIDGLLENKVPAEVAVADAERLPCADGSFDRIVSREVIEHVQDVDRFLAEIVRVARPGAVVVITTPNATSAALAHVASRLGLDERLYGTHEYKDDDLPASELEAAFARAGLVVERRFFDSAAWFWLSDLERTPLRRFVPRVGAWLQRLQGEDRRAAVFCDQIKYRLRVPHGERAVSEPQWRCPSCRGPVAADGADLRCGNCGTSYQLLGGRAPVFHGAPDADIGEASSTTAGTRAAFRAAFVVHSLAYLPALVLAALARR